MQSKTASKTVNLHAAKTPEGCPGFTVIRSTGC